LAGTRAILAALAKVTRRDRKSIFSFAGSNIAYLAMAFLFAGDPVAMGFFGTIIALVIFFPLTSDPLRKIPPDRLTLWPLTEHDHWRLRAVSIFLNPLIWILAGLLVWRRVTLGLWALVAVLFVVGFSAPWRFLGERHAALLWLPSFPSHLNQLIRKNLRELLATLDFYAALIFVIPAAAIRAAGRLPHDALLPMTLLVMVMISTCALSLFGLDGEGGFTRYRLLPLSGWQILAAKDAGFLLVSVVLTLPLNPIAGLAAALIALAVGHGISVERHGDEKRWRFQTSHSFPAAIIQLLLMSTAGAGAAWNPLVLALCAVIYAVSTWVAGRALEQQFADSME
jgi:hypothetical protein